MTTPDFPNTSGVERIPMFPASYGVAQRVAASKIATEKGKGLLMELHSFTTHFYADPTVPIGKVDIWCSPSYKALPVYVTTLDSPDQFWETESDKRTREVLARTQSMESAEDMKYRLDSIRDLANVIVSESQSPQYGRDILALLDSPIDDLRGSE